RALSALGQYLNDAVGELEQLQHARKRANLVDRLRCRMVVGRVLLGGEQDEGVGPHRLLEREDRLLASDEEGPDHVRKYDDVAQGQHRIGSGFTWRKRWARKSREFSKPANSTWRSSTIGWRCRTATAMIMPTPSNTAFAANDDQT